MDTEFTISLDITAKSLAKGEVREGKQLVAWDCIQDCNENYCPLATKCMYKSTNKNNKCSLQTQYLQAFVDTVFSTYRYLDEVEMYKVGMHLVPMYSQLCRMKIVEASVGSITYEDMKGVTRVHPIFREIRDTLKTISYLWKDIGVKPGNLDPGLPDYTGKEGFGDANHYTEITKNSNNKRDVIR